MDIPTWLSGPITVVLIVVLGVFVYPWLLQWRFGVVAVAAATILLAVLFDRFGLDQPSRGTNLGFALLWALVPVVTGVLVRRLQSKKSSED